MKINDTRSKSLELLSFDGLEVGEVYISRKYDTYVMHVYFGDYYNINLETGDHYSEDDHSGDTFTEVNAVLQIS